MSTAIEFRARNPADSTVDTDLYDVRPIRESINRFDSGVVLAFIDSDGTKLDEYEHGQRVDVQVSEDGGSTWTTQFPAITLTPKRTTNDGIPSVEIEALGYTHLLTRDTIERDWSSTAKSTILQNVIEDHTAVNWVAGNVDVNDDTAIDLTVRGETPDEVIQRIASQSSNETFYVNADLEFVFEQQDVDRAPAITDADVIDYDLPTEGKRAINKFTVYWGSNLGNAWTEEDREAQQDFKNKLGAPRRGIIGDADSFPEVTTEDEAKEIAKRRLGNQSIIQTGTVTVPLGRFDTNPGDVFSLTISDAGIDSVDFRVASKDTEWNNGIVELTIAENTAGDIEELLISLSDSLSNARLRDADPNATETLALRLRSGVTVSLASTLTTKTAGDGFVLGQSQLGQGSNDQLGGSIASTGSVTVESKKATMALLNLIRDLWQDGDSAFTDLTHVAVGTDESGATRADDSLQAEVGRVELEKFGAGDGTTEFEFVATIPAGGLFADSGTLKELSIADAASGGMHYARFTFDDTTIDASTRLKIHLEVTLDNDADEQGVITSTGQARIRDLIVGEANHEPTDAVYGTGTTDPAESDTALGSKQHEDTIDSKKDLEPGVAQLTERTESAEADTTNWSEVGFENAADELVQRITFEPYNDDVILEAKISMQATNA